MLPLALLMLVAPGASADVKTQSFVYGKYYSTSGAGGAKNTEANTYYAFTPSGHDAARDGKLPVVVEIHGGGFTGGSATRTPTAQIASAVANGIAWISVDYRLVATKYYYGSGSTEELIHVDAAGRLTLDTAGKTMDDYEIRRGRTEYNTKCSYDTVQFLEHLLAHADELGVDAHRIATTGGSAGGGEIHYLTWVYHGFPGNAARYTPVGMAYTMAQLDYPVQNMLDRVWGLWADDVGAGTKLSKILAFEDCGMIVGNPWCEEPSKSKSDYNLCNATWQRQSMSRFCDTEAAFDAATLGQVRDAQVWPREDPDVGPGMEVLWYNSVNMQKHAPRPFHLYIANQLNSTAGMNVVHNALYSRNYAKYAEKAGVNYTVYYTDYEGMTRDDAGEQRFAARGRAGPVVYNYRSSHGWIDQPGVRETARASAQEQLLFYCMVFGLEGCSVGPAPAPGPGPGPGPAPVSPACKKAIDATCPAAQSASDCKQCVHANARAFIAAGCPPAAQGGAQACVQYCESRS